MIASATRATTRLRLNLNKITNLTVAVRDSISRHQLSSTTCHSATSTDKHRISPIYKQVCRDMSSDADYAAFLDKANQNTSGPTSQSTPKTGGTKAVNTEIPAALQNIDEYYISEADEPFEPVSLNWEKHSLPSADEFSKLIGQQATKISHKEFDAHGQYVNVIDAVKSAGSHDLGFFRAELSHTKAELFAVSVDKQHKKLVGMKAVSIES